MQHCLSELLKICVKKSPLLSKISTYAPVLILDRVTDHNFYVKFNLCAFVAVKYID